MATACCCLVCNRVCNYCTDATSAVICSAVAILRPERSRDVDTAKYGHPAGNLVFADCALTNVRARPGLWNLTGKHRANRDLNNSDVDSCVHNGLRYHDGNHG